MLCFRKDTLNMVLEIGIPTKLSWKNKSGKFAIGTIDASTIGIFAFLIGWFVYGGFYPALYLFVFSIIIALISMVGIIPVAGPFIYWFLVRRDIVPRAVNKLGSAIDSFIAWPINILFYVCFANAILATLVSIFLIYRKLSDRADEYERKNA